STGLGRIPSRGTRSWEKGSPDAPVNRLKTLHRLEPRPARVGRREAAPATDLLQCEALIHPPFDELAVRRVELRQGLGLQPLPLPLREHAARSVGPRRGWQVLKNLLVATTASQRVGILPSQALHEPGPQLLVRLEREAAVTLSALGESVREDAVNQIGDAFPRS